METYVIIGTLAALNVGLFAWLRADIKDVRREILEQGATLRREMLEQGATLRKEHAGLRESLVKMGERMANLGERMAKVEGTLQGLCAAVGGGGQLTGPD